MHNISEGFLWYLAVLLSVVVHEASHAFAAMKLGDKTAYEGGQVTLDPFPHIKREPIDTVKEVLWPNLTISLENLDCASLKNGIR